MMVSYTRDTKTYKHKTNYRIFQLHFSEPYRQVTEFGGVIYRRVNVDNVEQVVVQIPQQDCVQQELRLAERNPVYRSMAASQTATSMARTMSAMIARSPASATLACGEITTAGPPVLTATGETVGRS